MSVEPIPSRSSSSRALPAPAPETAAIFRCGAPSCWQVPLRWLAPSTIRENVHGNRLITPLRPTNSSASGICPEAELFLFHCKKPINDILSCAAIPAWQGDSIMKRITRIIRPIICMAVLLFAMTTAVMGCYQKEAEPIDIPGRTPSGTSAPQPSATPAGEVIPSVDRQAELAEARAKNPDTVAWLYIPFSLSSRCFLIGSSPCGLSFLLFHALHGLFCEAVVHQRVKVHPLGLLQLVEPRSSPSPAAPAPSAPSWARRSTRRSAGDGR